MNWSCEQTEERLSDYLDSLLSAGELAEFNIHAAGCPRCAQLAAQVGATVRGIQALPPLETPPRLVTAILSQTLGPRAPRHGWRRWLAWTPALLEPRFTIGFATAAASLVILFYASGLNAARIHKADLNPVNMIRAVNRQTHLVYARGVKYVNDLRVVYEIQSRLHPMETPAREETPHAQPPSNEPGQKSQGTPHPDRSSNRSSALYAFVLAQTFTRSPQ